MLNRVTPELITELKPNEVFCFGSNSLGQHHAGAAKIAYEKFGARWGIGYGECGQSYAIDTMTGLSLIEMQIKAFLQHAPSRPLKQYLVTEIGCGIAGFTPEQIAPFFLKAKEIDNIHLSQSFWDVINKMN